MNIRLLGAAAACLAVVLSSLPVHADGDHPTVRAARRYTHRKVMKADHAVTHAGAHYKHWKQRKGHKVRAWLNKH